MIYLCENCPDLLNSSSSSGGSSSRSSSLLTIWVQKVKISQYSHVTKTIINKTSIQIYNIDNDVHMDCEPYDTKYLDSDKYHHL